MCICHNTKSSRSLASRSACSSSLPLTSTKVVTIVAVISSYYLLEDSDVFFDESDFALRELRSLRIASKPSVPLCDGAPHKQAKKSNIFQERLTLTDTKCYAQV